MRHNPDKRFQPSSLLRDPHLMTMAPIVWPRRHKQFKSTSKQRLFQVDQAVQLLSHCHWQPDSKSAPTILLIHGLEGSADSHYMICIAAKAFHLGFNVIRLNLRNCGGSMHLTPTLYNAGLSPDVIKVLRELKGEGYDNIFIAGYSLGGNIVLKAAGELAENGRELLRGVVAVSPSLDLHACVTAIEQPQNRLYERWFVRGLKQKIKEKARLFPDLYDVSSLDGIEGIRHFDNTYTAPVGGYGDVENYYTKASAMHVVDKISVPTLIVAAEDDPMVPISSIEESIDGVEPITLLATQHGGHAGYIAQSHEELPVFDRFWAENRLVKYCHEIIGSSNSQRF
jgi:predicted alpha/beta-fold hydrolase